MTLRDLGIANSGVFSIAVYLQNHSNHIIAYNDFGVQHIGMIVIILVQSAAISRKSSVHCAVSFKVIPLLSFLLISVLLLMQIFLDRPLCVCKLTGFLVRLIKFGVHYRQFLAERRDTLFQLFHGWNMSRTAVFIFPKRPFPLFFRDTYRTQ